MSKNNQYENIELSAREKIEAVRNKRTDEFTNSIEGFFKGAFYALSFVFFIDKSKPSLITLITAAGMTIPLFLGYFLLECILINMGFYDTQNGFYGKYKDVIIPAIVHFILGYFIYSAMR